MDKVLKFYVKVWYVMGKALSGELSYTWTGLVKIELCLSQCSGLLMVFCTFHDWL